MKNFDYLRKEIFFDDVEEEYCNENYNIIITTFGAGDDSCGLGARVDFCENVNCKDAAHEKAIAVYNYFLEHGFEECDLYDDIIFMYAPDTRKTASAQIFSSPEDIENALLFIDNLF